MLRLSEYIRTVHPKMEEAVNMWLLRSAIYGNTEAQDRVREEMILSPQFLEKSLISYQNFIPGKRSLWHSSGYPGIHLNAIGLLVFQPEESYTLAGINKNRFMVVWQYEDCDPADEDGFGREEYYNMFCLDEFFQLIPGVPMACNLSSHDISHSDHYFNMIQMAAEEMGRRDFPALWMDFLPEGK